MNKTNLVDVEHIKQRRASLAADVPVWIPRTLDQHLDHCAERWPDRTFFIADGQQWSYRQIAERSRALAGALHSHGVKQSTHVGLLAGNTPEYFAFTYAASRLGARIIPLNYLLAPQELAFILRQSRCEVVVTEPSIVGLDALEALYRACDSHRDPAATTPDPLPDLRSILLTTSPPSDAALRANTTEIDLGAPRFDGDSGSTPEGTSHVVYTSGSTGFPKGVMLHHDAILREGFGTALSRAFDDGWRVLTSLPSFHIFGLLQAVTAPTFVGGATVLEPSFDPVRQLRLFRELNITDTVCVPAMAQRLIDTARETGAGGELLRAMFCAGNAMPASVWHDVVDVLGANELTTAYGMTETCSIPFMVCPDDPFERLIDTVGKPKNSGPAGIADLHGTQMRCRVIDIDNGAVLPTGRDGELLFAGPTVTKAYWENPAENERCFRDGYLRSGDVGHLRDDGYLVLTGRTKEMFKSGGENVTPREVEIVLESHATVRQAIVVGIPDQRWGEVGFAWVVPATSEGIDTQELIDFCRERLAKYKVPRFVHAIEQAQIPTTGIGKIARKDLVTLAVNTIASESHDG